MLMEATCLDLQKQVKGLQDSRRELLAQMHNMVPRSDLQNALVEAEMLRASVAGLQKEAAAAQHEKERLLSSMQVRIVSMKHVLQCSCIRARISSGLLDPFDLACSLCVRAFFCVCTSACIVS